MLPIIVHANIPFEVHVPEKFGQALLVNGGFSIDRCQNLSS